MKKRIFTLLLAMVLLVTFVPMSVMAEEKENESILYYDDFETDKFSGALQNNVSGSVTNEEFYAGENSLKITGYTRTYDMGPEYSLTNKVKQGHTYEFSFWAKVPEGSDPMIMRLKMSYNRNGTTSYPNIVGNKEINGDDWTEFKGSYTFSMPLEEISSIGIYIETLDEYLGTPYFIDEFLIKDTLGAEPLQEEDERLFTKVPTNLVGTPQGEAVEFLSALKIVDFTGDGEFSFEDKMSRDVFGNILEKFYADPAVVANFKTVNPTSSVTYNDAARGFINVLGYDTIVKSSKTRAYLPMAAELGITKGIKANATEGVTNADMLLMLYNLAEISPLRPEIVGNPTKYGVDKDVTLYTEYYKMYKAEGVVTGTYNSMLADESTLGIDTVEIDNELYYLGNTKADSFLGLSVSYYYVVDPKDESKTLICVSEDKNDIIKIESKDIVSFVGGKYTYLDEKGREEEIKVSVDASIIYNGQFKGTLSEDEFVPLDGTVTFVDADRDDKYEIIKIDDIKYVTVARVDVYKTAFYGLNGEYIEFDGYDKNTVFDIRDSEGKIVKLSSILPDDLLCVKESKGAKKHFIQIDVLKNTVEGAISEMSLSDRESSYIVIDEVTYTLTGGLINAFNNYLDEASHPIEAEVPSIGNVVRLMLTADGKVAGLKTVSISGIDYGYVIGAQMGTKAFDDTLKLRIVKSDGEIANFNTTEKITVDGNRVNSNSTGVEATFCPAGVTTKQLIGYRINEEGKIVVIDTTYTDTAKETSIALEKVFPLAGSTTTSYKYYSSMSVLGNMLHSVATDAIVFVVPYYETDNEEIYNVGEVSSMLSNNSSYEIVGYSTSGTDYVSNILIVKNDGHRALASTSPMMLVNKITKVINSDGEERTKITGLVKNSEVSILAEDRTEAKVLSSVVPGDMIRYRIGLNDELTIKDEGERQVSNFAHIVNLTRDKLPNILTSLPTDYAYGAYYRIGTVMSYKDNYLQIKLSNNDSLITVNAGQFNIAKYNKEKGIYEASTAGAIIDYETNPEKASTVFIRTTSRSPVDLVIYE